jgi:hypothetical protein
MSYHLPSTNDLTKLTRMTTLPAIGHLAGVNAVSTSLAFVNQPVLSWRACDSPRRETSAILFRSIGKTNEQQLDLTTSWERVIR